MPRRVAHIDMRDLVVGHRERRARAGVERLAPVLLAAYREQARRAQRAVDVDRVGRRRDAVFRDHDHPPPLALRRLDQLAAERVDLAEVLLQPRDARGPARGAAGRSRGAAGRRASASACRVAITCSVASRDPSVEEMSATGPQNLKSGNCPSLAFELVAQLRRVGVVVGDLAAVGRIHRPRRRRTSRRAEYMLYHQNILAQVKAGSRALPASQTFSPATSPFDCRQSRPPPGRGNTSRWPRRRGRTAAGR